MKPSVLSLYSPTMGGVPPSCHRFGYRFGHRSGYGGLPSGLVTGLVTGPVMGGLPPFTSHYITSHAISTKAPFTGGNKRLFLISSRLEHSPRMREACGSTPTRS